MKIWCSQRLPPSLWGLTSHPSLICQSIAITVAINHFKISELNNTTCAFLFISCRKMYLSITVLRLAHFVVAVVCPAPLLSNVSLNVYSTICLCIHLLIAISVVSSLGFLQKEILTTSLYWGFNLNMSSFLFGKCTWVGFLGQMIYVY